MRQGDLEDYDNGLQTNSMQTDEREGNNQMTEDDDLNNDIMSMTQQKSFAADKDTIKSCWSQSLKEGGNGTEDNPDVNTNAQNTPRQNQQNPKSNQAVRTDRYGNEIVPRSRRLKTGEKTSYKLTFMDKIEKQKEEY